MFIGIFLFLKSQVHSQTCNPAVQPTSPDSRYLVQSSGTVSDLNTGLMWKKCPEGLSGDSCQTGTVQTLSWQSAFGWAQEVNRGNLGTNLGITNWRIPNIKELASLPELSCYEPSLNENLFPNTPGNRFWTSSPNMRAATEAWYVNFNHGQDGSASMQNLYSLRLVREME